MADIRVTSTGKEFRRIDNGVALLLEEMFPAALERINSPDAAPAPVRATGPTLKPLTTVQWSVGQHPKTGEHFVRAFDGRQEHFYIGPPERAELVSFWLCGGEQHIPAEIIEQYARAKNVPDPEGLAEAARERRETLETEMKERSRGRGW